jgi:hypothetical protein
MTELAAEDHEAQLSTKLASVGPAGFGGGFNQLALRVNAAHAATRASAAQALKHAIECGGLLASAKDALPHGAWLPWLRSGCPEISERVAQGYMRLYRHQEELKSEGDFVFDLTIERAMALIAKPRTEGEPKAQAAATSTAATPPITKPSPPPMIDLKAEVNEDVDIIDAAIEGNEPTAGPEPAIEQRHQFPEYVQSARGSDDITANQITESLEAEMMADRLSVWSLDMIARNAAHLVRQYAPRHGRDRLKVPRSLDPLPEMLPLDLTERRVQRIQEEMENFSRAIGAKETSNSWLKKIHTALDNHLIGGGIVPVNDRWQKLKEGAVKRAAHCRALNGQNDGVPDDAKRKAAKAEETERHDDGGKQIDLVEWIGTASQGRAPDGE